MTGAPSRIVIPGGAGYLGRALSAALAADGHDVVVLSRRPAGGPDASPARHAQWNGATPGPWVRELDGAAAVINLAGRTVNCRYTAANRAEIYGSRLNSTRVLGEAIAQCAAPPATWLNASSATIYRHAEDRPMDEATGEIGSGFSVDVCRRWEQALADAPTPHTRKVALRSAMVFGPGRDGVFEAFHRLVRLGLGGTLGPGSQYVSWVHLDDFVASVRFLLARGDLDGAVNVSAPVPVPNRDFMRAFREACGVPVGLPATRWMLEVGAVALRTETELLLKSRRVVPGRLLDAGFSFRHPEPREAIASVLAVA